MSQLNKVAIVTGGAHGIGAEIAHYFLTRQMHVVIADKDISTKDSFLDDPSRLLFHQTDISNENSVKKLIEYTIKQFGRIDCLVNNAGLLPDACPAIENLPLKKWNEFIQTNLTGMFLCSKYAIPALRKNQGTIVNIASTRALQSEGNDGPYAASKGGIVAFTHTLAMEIGPDIRVNCVSPGWIHTDKKPLRKADHQQHPVGRVGKPEDIASIVYFLASDEAGFITGQNFIVDGGMTVKMIYK